MSTLYALPAGGDIQTVMIGEVRAWMGRRGINQTQMAQYLGITQSQFSKRLHGKIPITVVELGKIATALDVEPSVLLGGAPPSLRPDGPGTAVSPPSVPKVDYFLCAA